MAATINNLFQMFKDSVIYAQAKLDGSGNEIIQGRAQTFAVIPKMDLSVLNTENLEKNISEVYREYFFSRLMQDNSLPEVKFKYPLLGMFEQNVELKGLFTKESSRVVEEVYNLELFCLIQYDYSKGEDNININDILYEYAKNILYYSVRYVGNCVKAQIQYADTSLKTGWYNLDVLDQAVTAGVLTTYTIDSNESNNFANTFTQSNKDIIMVASSEELGDHLYGRSIFFKFNSKCFEVETPVFNSKQVKGI